jgi:hypothetical protein
MPALVPQDGTVCAEAVDLGCEPDSFCRSGVVAEWFKAAVLKTAEPERVP